MALFEMLFDHVSRQSDFEIGIFMHSTFLSKNHPIRIFERIILKGDRTIFLANY